jgi:hypothetical protein
VNHRELQKTTRSKNASDLQQGPLRVGHVHQAHERGHGVEGTRHERQHGPVAHDVVDPARGELAGGADELLGDVERDDFSALARQQPGVVPLSAAEIERA